MELCMREKAVFFLPVNILTVWSPAFLAARHTTVCLDMIKIMTVLPSTSLRLTNNIHLLCIYMHLVSRLYAIVVFQKASARVK